MSAKEPGWIGTVPYSVPKRGATMMETWFISFLSLRQGEEYAV